MAYEKQSWIDRIVADDTGEVLQVGTIVNATRMNHIEEGIEANDSALTLLKGTTNGVTISSLKTDVTNLENDVENLKALEAEVDGHESRITVLENFKAESDVTNKVDKVPGKGLSTNDYDNAAKAKVDSLPENPGTKLAGKVDKLEGKGLSTNDFTNEYKTKVDNAAKQADLNTLLAKVEALETWKNDVLAGNTAVNIDQTESL